MIEVAVKMSSPGEVPASDPVWKGSLPKDTFYGMKVLLGDQLRADLLSHLCGELSLGLFILKVVYLKIR